MGSFMRFSRAARSAGSGREHDVRSAVISVRPIALEGHGVRLEPLELRHEPDLAAAAADGALWELWYTVVPHTTEAKAYIERALAGQEQGRMLPWAVRDLANGKIVGSTRYHDIVADIDRVEIGYTWYAKSSQRSHVNTSCKLLLLTHAFEALGCKVVGLRTDKFNFNSQRAIEALGAKKDGMIRHFGTRRDGSARDVVMYSIIASEWPEVKQHLTRRLERHRTGAAEGVAR
jgi:N-acetyltransferase